MIKVRKVVVKHFHALPKNYRNLVEKVMRENSETPLADIADWDFRVRIETYFAEDVKHLIDSDPYFSCFADNITELEAVTKKYGCSGLVTNNKTVDILFMY